MTKHDSDMITIAVILEEQDGNLTPLSREVLAGASALAQTYGAVLESLVLKSTLPDYDPASFADEAAARLGKAAPQLILMGASSCSSGFCALLAEKLSAGLLCDCTEIRFEAEYGFCPLRPNAAGSEKLIYGTSGGRPLIATVRPGVFAAAKAVELIPADGELRMVSAAQQASAKLISLLDERAEKKQGVDITKADILVAGGRGIASCGGFEQLKTLAELLGGEIAASRACIEAGWADASMQVGQTGRTVHPKLYIACGISGAIQHVTGMKDAECIIAINKNPAAPIFDIADLGIVGNLENILPALIKALQEKKGEANAV